MLYLFDRWGYQQLWSLAIALFVLQLATRENGVVVGWLLPMIVKLSHHQYPLKNTFSPLQQQRSSSNESHDCPSNSLPTELAVFPLRKSVKLPTDTLTLNLYEERYLAMCDYLFQQPTPTTGNNQILFGAIYGSDKPQMVVGGTGPIVPLYEPGDIGTIFAVEHSEEGYRRDDPTLGRRIRIHGEAIGRFRIETILHNGYNGGGAAKRGKGEEPFPFIVVEPCKVQDVAIAPGSTEEQKLMELQRKIQEKVMAASSVTSAALEGPTVRTTDIEEGDSEGDDSQDGLDTMNSSGDVASDFLSSTLLNGDCPPLKSFDGIAPNDERELFSFAACLALTSGRAKTPGQMQSLLRTTSTLERLEFVLLNL